MSRRSLWRMLAAPPDQPRCDPAQVDSLYRHWRLRTMAGIFGGYAVYYLCRKNISVAMPAMGQDGYDTAQMGLLLTGTSLAYGASKLVNGVLGDRANARWFMAVGLAASALVNILFGLKGLKRRPRTRKIGGTDKHPEAACPHWQRCSRP